MFKAGITGNIGSGKTTVSRIFEVLGIPVFYADLHAKKVMTEDPILMADIKSTFGTESYFEDGSLNRKYIAGIVFNDERQLAQLNAIVHPATFRAFDTWVEQFNGNQNIPYILKEAALMFESDSYKMCDKTIIVAAPLEMRVSRVMHRDQITRKEVLSREARQLSEEVKIQRANYVITNDDMQLVIPQVLALHAQLLSLAASK